MSEITEKGKPGRRSSSGPDYGGTRGRGRGRGRGKVQQRRLVRPGGQPTSTSSTQNSFPDNISVTQDQYQDSDDHCGASESKGPISQDLPKPDVQAQTQGDTSTGHSTDTKQSALRLPNSKTQDEPVKLTKLEGKY